MEAGWSRRGQFRLSTSSRNVAEELIRRSTALLERRFKVLVVTLAGAYLIIQFRYIMGLPLVMDEFANAGHIFRVTQGVPYRDYVPYKTVLGYYMLLPSLLAFESSWQGMLAAKAEIAVVTSGVLAAASLRLKRHFGAPAILGALLLLCTQSTLLERASELRVDMLSALLGLVSLIGFLERRPVWSGVAAACAVLMTQKGAYFALSLGCASAWCALRTRRPAVFVEALISGLSALAAFAAYLAFWCAVGDPEFVWQSMFEGPRRIAFAPLYEIRHFWSQTIDRNPVFYALGAAGLLLLLPRRGASPHSVDERLWAYSLVHIALCVWHKQPWPYFFVMLIPTTWMLGVAALDRQTNRGPAWTLGVVGLVVAGAIASLVERMPVVLERSSVGQRRVVEAASAFLAPGDTYLAGTELLWRHRHMAHLSWLDMPRMDDVRRAPDVPLRALVDNPPKLVIDNYRIQGLPPTIRTQLQRSFASVGGNLWTYAPMLPEGRSDMQYAYGGLYRVVGAPGGRISVDGGPWLGTNDGTYLTLGPHQVRMEGDARLAAWSNAKRFAEQTLRPDIRLFDRVYSY